MGVQSTRNLIRETLAESSASLAAKIAVVLHAKNFRQETQEKTVEFIGEFLNDPNRFIQEHGTEDFSIERTYKLLRLSAQGTKLDLETSPLPKGIEKQEMQVAIDNVYKPKAVTPFRVAMAVLTAAAFTATYGLRSAAPQAGALVAVPQFPTCPMPLVAPKASELVPHGTVNLPIARPPLELPSDSFLMPLQGCDRFPGQMIVEQPMVPQQPPTARQLVDSALDASSQGFRTLGLLAAEKLEASGLVPVVQQGLQRATQTVSSLFVSSSKDNFNQQPVGITQSYQMPTQQRINPESAAKSSREFEQQQQQNAVREAKRQNVEQQEREIVRRNFASVVQFFKNVYFGITELPEAAKARREEIETQVAMGLDLAEPVVKQALNTIEERRSEIEREVATQLDRLPNVTARVKSTSIQALRTFATRYMKPSDTALASARNWTKPVRDWIAVPTWIMRGYPDYAESMRLEELNQRNERASQKIRALKQEEADKKAAAAYHETTGRHPQGTKLGRPQKL